MNTYYVIICEWTYCNKDEDGAKDTAKTEEGDDEKEEEDRSLGVVRLSTSPGLYYSWPPIAKYTCKYCK